MAFAIVVLIGGTNFVAVRFSNRKYTGVINQPLPVGTRPKLGPEPCLTCAE